MRAFNLTAPTRNPSIENAIQAGSLSHTGNTYSRPIGAPVKRISSINTGGGSIFRPRANPVGRVSQGINGGTVSTFNATPGVISRPVAHIALPIRGILGQ